MINPETITNYNLDDYGLEEHILFWICAAGKNGTTMARCLDSLLKTINGYEEGPFNAIKKWALYENPETLEGWPEMLKAHGIGCYNIKAKAMYQIATSGLNLRTCTVSDLESIYGIGPKTARCFLLHSRKGARVAGLDTHMLKHLKSLGFSVPKSTPTGKKYRELELAVLGLADAEGMTPAEYDLYVWTQYNVPSKPPESFYGWTEYHVDILDQEKMAYGTISKEL